MIYCSSPIPHLWVPSYLPSGQPVPQWTRVHCGPGEVTNALESVEWEKNPVQVILCDACGSRGCADAGDVHISRLADALLWTRPRKEPADEWEVIHFDVSELIRRRGSIVFPSSAWEQLQKLATLPDHAAYPLTTRADLLSAWLLETRFSGDLRDPDELPRILKARLLGCDTLSPAEAIDGIENMLAWIRSDPDAVVSATLVRPEVVGASVETLYFDGPGEEDWPALARVAGRLTFSFGREWMLQFV